MSNLLLTSAVALTLLVAWPAKGWSQESVQTAQSLYASAAYDEALELLERLRQQPLSPSEVRAVNQQRAFCLLALGRLPDAEAAIAAVVQVDPTYRPDAASASPRVRTAFRDVRARLLPGIAQAEYVEARRLYDAESWTEAATAFRRVAALSADPDLAEPQVASLADLRMLADGFARLAEAAATPPPPPPASEPAASTPPPIDFDAVFDGSQPDVVAPVTVRQDLPRWSGGGRPLPRTPGSLEVVIGKNGVVERATLTQPIATFFDRQVLEATKNWRYQPAQFHGQPVRFRKIIKITFQVNQ